MERVSRLNYGAANAAPIFVEGPSGRLLFSCFNPFQKKPSGKAVLCLPPFAEELNKSRRMLSMMARRIAAEGTIFLLPDLVGTGDSAGDIADADHDTWCRDVRFAVSWLYESGVAQIDVLAVRYGSLLLESCLQQTSQQQQRIVFWNPVISGKSMLNQFLRTKLAAEMRSGATLTVSGLRQIAADEGRIEVAGYILSNRLLASIDAASLQGIESAASPSVLMINTSPMVDAPPPANVKSLISNWRAMQVPVDYKSVEGSQFWMSPEIQEVTELLQITAEFLGDKE